MTLRNMVNDGGEPLTEGSGIKLSFCIPTLNRGSFIGETLKSIVSQATDEVEIVIVDGGSKDDTEEVVRGYQLRFPRLRYVREDPHETGLPAPASSGKGFDHDCNRAVELARGEYCWLFTDDDILKPGAIQAVLDATEKHYGLVIVNAEVRNADLSELLEPKRLQFSADRIYTATENRRLFTDVVNYLSFMGGVVIRRQLWSARVKDSCFGTLFIHCGVIFQSPLPDDTLVIAEPLISIRYGNAMWHAKSFEIWAFRWPNLVWSFPDYPESVKHQTCPKEPWRRMRTLLLHRAEGSFTMKEYLEWLEPRLDSYWARAVAKAIAQFPGRVANFLGILYCHARRRRPGQMLVLLNLMNSPFYFWKWRNRRPPAKNTCLVC